MAPLPPPVTPLIVVRAFAPAPHNWLAAHRGVDLRARPGQTVSAPGRCEVAFNARIADRPVLALRCEGVRFTFEPVRSRLPTGSVVGVGQGLGRIAQGGHCDGLCLHWGAKVAGRYVDPLTFLHRTAPVLKPVSR